MGGGVERTAANESPKWNLLSTSSSLLPNSKDAMTWHIGDHGFEMTLSPGIPTLIRQHLRIWSKTRSNTT